MVDRDMAMDPLSAEYRAFQKHYQRLKIGLDASQVAGEAFSEMLLTAEEKGRVLVGGLTKEEMGERLLEPIGRRILADPRQYDVFVDVLDREPVYKEMVEALEGTGI